MTSHIKCLKDVEYGAPNPFGKVTVQKTSIKTKAEFEDIRRYCMAIDDGKTMKNDLAENKAPCI